MTCGTFNFTKLQFRRGTASEWTSVNPVLAIGEPGYESDTGKIKIGNGTTAWNSLPYFDDRTANWTDITGRPDSLTDFINDANFITLADIPTIPTDVSDLTDTNNIIPGEYVLPIASGTILGGVKVGANLTIDGNGVLTAGDPYDHGNITITGVDEQTITGNLVDGNIQLTPNGLGTVVINSDLHMVSGTEFSIGGAMMKATDGQFELDSDMVPAQNNTVSLGTTDLRWQNVWIGPGTLVLTDETLGTDVTVTARDNNFVVEGTAGLTVGNFAFLNNTLTFGDQTADISIGSATATGIVKFNRGIKVVTPAGDETFSVTRDGRVQIDIPTTILAGDPGALNIVGSSDGSYQPVTQAGGVLHLTGNDNVPTRFTVDSFGALGIPTWVARRARGIPSAPETVQAGDVLSRQAFAGWTGDRFGQVAAGPLPTSIDVVATENFTGTAIGSEVQFYNAPTGTATRKLSLKINSDGLTLPTATSITFPDATVQTTAWTSTATVNYTQITGEPTNLSEFVNDITDFGNIKISGDTVENTVHGNDLILTVEGGGLHAGDGDVNVIAKEFHVHTGGNADAVFKVEATGQTRILTPTFDSTKGAFSIVGSTDTSVVAPQNVGVMAHLTGQPATPSRIYNDGAANYSAYIGRRYNGTSASPTAVLSGQIISRIGATPYINGTANWPTISTSRIDFVASENQTEVAQGNKIEFYSVPTGSTSIARDITVSSLGITFRDGTSQDTAAIPLTQKGVANGVASLGGDGRVPSTQLPAGATVFKGGWDASTDTPDLGDNLPAGVQAGWQYIVTVAGTIDIGNGTETFSVGDLVIYDGANWVRIPAGDSGVSTFNGRSDAVTLTSLDVTTALTYTPYNGTTNPNGYVNSSQAAAAAPVQTVFGRAGDVVLASSDVITALSAGSIANAKLQNSQVTIGTTSISLGATSLTLGGLTTVTATTFVGALTGNADTVTNGVVTTGSYTDPAWLTLTKSKVGLGNVDNTSDANKPVSTATQTALNLKANLASPTFTGTVSGITATMVGLGNVDNTSDINKPVSTATQTALNLKAPLASPTFTGTVSGITKAMVGLGNVENTALSTWAGSTSITTVGTLATLTVTAPITGSVSGNAGTVTNGVYTTDTGTVTNTMLAGNIANAKLVNSSVTVNNGAGISGGGTVQLGGSITLTNTDTGSAQAIFKNIAVAGQTTVTSTVNNDTATFVAGSGMTITTSGKNITFASTGIGAGVSSLTGGNNIVLSGPTGAVTIERVDGLQNVVTGNSGATYNLALTDQYFGTTCPLTGAVTVTLPLGANVPVGRQFIIKDESGNADDNYITISRSGADLIDGSATQRIRNRYGSLTVMWTGTQWSRI